jgi:CRISPR-associated protein Cas1
MLGRGYGPACCAIPAQVAPDDEQEFRQACIESLTRNEALDFMIDSLKAVAQQLGGSPR